MGERKWVERNGSNRPPVPWFESSPFRNWVEWTWVDLEKCQVQVRQHIDFDPSPFDPIRPQSIRPKLFDQKGRPNSFRPISFDPFHAIPSWLPISQGIMVTPSGRLPSVWYSPRGSSTEGNPRDPNVCFMREVRVVNRPVQLLGQGHFVISHLGDNMASVTWATKVSTKWVDQIDRFTDIFKEVSIFVVWLGRFASFAK